MISIRISVSLFTSILFSGCCNLARYTGPIETPDTTSSEFFRPYKDALSEVGGDTDSPLIHLGFPTTDKIKIWYSLPQNSKKPENLRVRVNGSQISNTKINHFWNTQYKTGIIEVIGLSSDTSYQVSILSSNLRTTKSLTVKTLQSKSTNKPVSFIFGSCFQPFNYKPKEGGRFGEIKQENQASLRILADRAKSKAPHSPSFSIFLGDQIYTDPGADQKHPDLAYLYGQCSEKLRGTLLQAPDYLTKLHRYHFSIPKMNETLQALPSVMMWDDHDIRDGWGSQGDEEAKQWQEFFGYARDSFVAFQGVRNLGYSSQSQPRFWEPNLPSNLNTSKKGAQSMHHSFESGLGSFFIMDGRTNKKDVVSLGETQKSDIQKWLLHRGNKPTVFVFACPVPISIKSGGTYKLGRLWPSMKDDIIDRMGKHERAWLFNTFVEHFKHHKNQKLLILAGDVHYSGLADLSLFENGQWRNFGHEVVSSGIAQSDFVAIQSFIGGTYGTSKGTPDFKTKARGLHSGPCFAEIELNEPKSSNHPPEIGLMFYPTRIMSPLNVTSPAIRRVKLPLITDRAIFKDDAVKGRWPRLFTESRLDDGLKAFWSKQKSR